MIGRVWQRVGKLASGIRERRLLLPLTILSVLLVWYAFALPKPLFQTPYSLVLEDQQGQLLGARIASDGQWRFPLIDTLPERFVQALTEFEDRRFFSHTGVDLYGLARAARQNLANRRIVSGGSTLSMQVIRLARQPEHRSLWQKLIEMLLAGRLELRYSKDEILRFYASHAPFGGNTVGLEAASWRYYGKQPKLLSWGEAATLAVLPNSPALIHPGRNRDALLRKRNRLLDRLRERGALDSLSCDLAKAEPLPDSPHPLPRLAPHLLDRIGAERKEEGGKTRARFRTTLDRQLQRQVTDVLERHLQNLQNNGIHNLSALVVEVGSGEVKAYVGNILGAGAEHGEQVDVIPAARSTGSILKPFLYALALDDGLITPRSLLADVPTSLHGYRPENFYNRFDGLVPAERALVRSLNVPMVRLLQQYGLEKFHHRLRQLGMTTLFRPAADYGLPLVLGGAEGSLWDLAGMYAGMARTLENFQPRSGEYATDDFRSPSYLPTPLRQPVLSAQPPVLSAAAVWLTFEAMQQVERPNSEGEWERFQSAFPVAWKTGTSFGFRDAWAIGVTPGYVVAVWAGNADGEGRPGLVGVQAAAPALFAIFDLLPGGGWFRPPLDEMQRLPVCAESGGRPLAICPVDSLWLPPAATEGPPCTFHQTVHLDASGEFQINASCASPLDMKHVAWFVLPPLEEYYYKPNHPEYRLLPPFRDDCQPEEEDRPLQLIYPRPNTRILVPKDLDGVYSRTVFQAAHRQPETTIYWHLDETFLGATTTFHQMELHPPPGEHLLTLVDANGYRLQRKFEVVGREE